MKIVVAYLLLIFGLGINYIFNISVARLLGPAKFGDFSYALYLFNIFAMIGISSLDMAALKFIPQTAKPKEIRVAIQTLAIISGIIFSLGFIFTIYFSIEDKRAALAYLFVPSIIPFILLTVNVAVLQAEHIVGPRMAFRYVVEPVTKICAFFLLFLFFHESAAPAIAFFIALVVTNVAAFAVYWDRLGGIKFSFFINKFKILFKFIVPMFVSGTVSVLSGRLDILILGALIAASNLGHYSAALQTAGILLIVLQGIETVYAPIFSSHIGNKNFVALKEDYQRALRWTTLIASPLVTVFFIYPEVVMLPFGPEYQGAATILAVLCVGQLILLSLGAANSILVLLGKTKIVLLTSVIFILSTALFVGVGAYYRSTLGAAVGVVTAIAVTNVIRTYYVYKLTRCHPFSLHYSKIMLALVFATTFGYLSKSFFGYFGVIGFPALLLLLILILGLHPEEKATLRKIYLKFIR